MSINHTFLGTKNISDPDVISVIEFLQFQPVEGTIYSPARTPGQLVGSYNGVTDLVELYVVNNAGTGFLRVG